MGMEEAPEEGVGAAEEEERSKGEAEALPAPIEREGTGEGERMEVKDMPIEDDVVRVGWEEKVLLEEAVSGGDTVPTATLMEGELKEVGEVTKEKVAASDVDPVGVGWEEEDRGLGKENVDTLL